MTSSEPAAAAAAEQDSGSGNLGTSVEEMLAQLHLTGDDTQVSRDGQHELLAFTFKTLLRHYANQPARPF